MDNKKTQEEKKDNKKIILMMAITIVLIPFCITIYINNKSEDKEEIKKQNPFYEEKIIITDTDEDNISTDNINNDNEDIINDLDEYTIKNIIEDRQSMAELEPTPSNTPAPSFTPIPEPTPTSTPTNTINNSNCDRDLNPINSIYNKYIYYNTIKNGCAMITEDNSKYIAEYTAKAYNKAVSLKSKWEDTYIESKSDETGTFAYGKYTIKNKNGNILGFAITLTYNTSVYALDSNDNWVLIKK